MMNDIYLLKFTFWGAITLAGLAVVAITGTVFGWRISELFIPPRDHWTKSYIAVFGAKVIIALMGGYLAVVGVSYLITLIAGYL